MLLPGYRVDLSAARRAAVHEHSRSHFETFNIVIASSWGLPCRDIERSKRRSLLCRRCVQGRLRCTSRRRCPRTGGRCAATCYRRPAARRCRSSSQGLLTSCVVDHMNWKPRGICMLRFLIILPPWTHRSVSSTSGAEELCRCQRLHRDIQKLTCAQLAGTFKKMPIFWGFGTADGTTVSGKSMRLT